MSEILREIIFDTETTGLKANDGDRVIEIGAVELINRFPSGKTFHVFVNPEGKEVHPEALKIHGISNEFLNDKPKFSELADEFLEFFSTGSLIAHNASFDTGFLNAELKRLGKPPINNERVIDTLQIARRKHPMGPNSLDALCSRYNIDNSKREKHGALLDSEILAEVYIELLGGRQTSFSLEHDEGNGEGSASQTNEDGSVQLMQRPKPLAPRLTDEDIQKHRDYIQSISENSIWKKTGGL
jgi:DNA polymerase-3 subunit epsilon